MKKYILLAWTFLLLLAALILNRTVFAASGFDPFPLALFLIVLSLLSYNILSLPAEKNTGKDDSSKNKVLVPMSVGTGYTFNFANKWVVFVLVIGLALLILPHLL